MDGEIQGHTTLYGDLLAVENSTAHIRALNGELITASLPAEGIDGLAERVGTQIGVRGLATYEFHTMAIVAFTIDELTPYHKVPLLEAWNSLAEALAPHFAWAKTPEDIDAYVKWVRGTDEGAGDERFDKLFGNEG